MTLCLAVGCRECQCFQNFSCSVGIFSLSNTIITTLCNTASTAQLRQSRSRALLTPPSCPALMRNTGLMLAQGRIWAQHIHLRPGRSRMGTLAQSSSSRAFVHP